ncbi:Mtc1 [Kluyveromyces lactis]|nr:Mtc1 [Kluyveromyces lactis]
MTSDADDVLEFLDSLPASTAKGKGKVSGNGGQDEDIMEFLDELENSNLDIKKKPSKKDNPQSSKKQEKPEKKPESNEKPVEETASKEKPSEQKGEEEHVADEGEEAVQDPLASISNWWSSSGSATVSSFWNKTTEQANQLKEKIATQEGNLKINDIGARLTALQGSHVISGLTSQLTKIVIGETDEVIRIHLVHDLHNLNEETITYQVEDQFERLLSQQVQGGIRIFADEWDHGKKVDDNVNLNLFQGKAVDGEKLCLANLDNAIKTWETAKKQSRRSSNPVSKVSDLFVSILACEVTGKDGSSEADSNTVLIDASRQNNFHFIVILKDISNDILLIVRSQGYPSKWAKWLQSDALSDEESTEKIDPSDWVKPWISEGLDLTFGILAQQYVISRMNL